MLNTYTRNLVCLWLSVLCTILVLGVFVGLDKSKNRLLFMGLITMAAMFACMTICVILTIATSHHHRHVDNQQQGLHVNETQARPEIELHVCCNTSAKETVWVIESATITNDTSLHITSDHKTIVIVQNP